MMFDALYIRTESKRYVMTCSMEACCRIGDGLKEMRNYGGHGVGHDIAMW